MAYTELLYSLTQSKNETTKSIAVQQWNDLILEILSDNLDK
jgi:hypothetical protein